MSKSKKGPNSILMKVSIIPLATRVCTVSGNVCFRFHHFHVNSLIGVRVMDKVNDFLHKCLSKKGHTSIIIIARSMPFNTHEWTVSSNVCFRFNVNILNGFRVMGKFTDSAQLSKSNKGNNSILIKARGMFLPTHVCIVSGNVWTNLYLNILNVVFRVVAKVQDFAQSSKSKRGRTQ